ncbi:MAG TPA: DUF1269 domain-containing protein [Actinomycetes bacterium]|nr:DUF1269 domain-containing protein [Actinomycetes bacterium]
MADKDVFLYLGTYKSEDDARADYDTVKALHEEGVIGTYDMAIVSKDEHDKIHVHKREKPTEHGAWTGVAVGALVGILFPPSIIAAGVVGGVTGGMVGHFWRGMSRADVKDLGELIDEGQAALVVVGESKFHQYLDRAFARAQRRIERQVKADAKALQKELDEASKRRA